MVYLIFVRSFTLLLFFYIPLLLCSIPCKLFLLAPISLTYDPFYIEFFSIVLLSPVYFDTLFYELTHVD